jgi:hypothetical protein
MKQPNASRYTMIITSKASSSRLTFSPSQRFPARGSATAVFGLTLYRSTVAIYASTQNPFCIPRPAWRVNSTGAKVGRMCRIAKTTECTSLAKRSRCVSWTWLTLSHLQSGHDSGDSGLSPSANPPVPESLTPCPQVPPRFCLITGLAKRRAGTVV